MKKEDGIYHLRVSNLFLEGFMMSRKCFLINPNTLEYGEKIKYVGEYYDGIKEKVLNNQNLECNSYSYEDGEYGYYEGYYIEGDLWFSNNNLTESDIFLLHSFDCNYKIGKGLTLFINNVEGVSEEIIEFCLRRSLMFLNDDKLKRSYFFKSIDFIEDMCGYIKKPYLPMINF